MTEAKAKKTKTAPTHPPALDMIKHAIKNSQEKKGLSLILIKKYIKEKYGVNIEKYSPFLRRALTHAVEKGALVRVGNKGKGASGTFKLPTKTAPKAEGGAAKVAKPKKVTKKVKKVVKKDDAKTDAKPAKKETPKKAGKPKSSPKKVKAAAKPTTPKVKKAVKPKVKKAGKSPKKSAKKAGKPAKK